MRVFATTVTHTKWTVNNPNCVVATARNIVAKDMTRAVCEALWLWKRENPFAEPVSVHADDKGSAVVAKGASR